MKLNFILKIQTDMMRICQFLFNLNRPFERETELLMVKFQEEDLELIPQNVQFFLLNSKTNSQLKFVHNQNNIYA